MISMSDVFDADIEKSRNAMFDVYVGSVDDVQKSERKAT